MSDRSQRTEQPTGKRLQQARDKGNVPRSKEIPAALTLGTFLVFCHLGGASWLSHMQRFLVSSFERLARPELSATELNVLLGSLLGTTAILLAGPLGSALVAGVGGNLLQGRPPMTFKPLTPDFSKVNPFKGIRKVIKLRSIIDLAKLVAKLVLFSTIAVFAVREALILGLPGAPGAEGALAAIFSLSGTVIGRVTALAFVLAFADLLFSRYDWRRNLRMTKQEVKDERKEQDGDPIVKARIRSKQMEMARSRMMADVPRATVVVTNPTHFAIALRYVPGETDVPQLLAKGRAKIAERIREIAIENGVPVVSDPPLARALYRSVRVGAFIPAALFRAVAEVLALVLRGKRGTRPAGGRR